MKKNIIAFGLALSLLSFLNVSADYPQSGVDLDNSTVTIGFIRDTGGAAFSCTQPNPPYTSPKNFNTGVAIPFNASNADYQESDGTFDGLVDCFYSAGDYTLDIHLVDNAGNSNDYTESFEIKAGTPVEIKSTLDGTCDDKVANNSSFCELTLTLKDNYGNTVPQNGTNSQSPNVHSPTDEFSDDANLGIKFRGGLQIKGSGAYTNLPQTAGIDIKDDGKFSLKALAPSIQEENSTGTTLSRLIDRTLTFVFTNLFQVEADGSVGTTEIITPIEIVRDDIKFSNPVHAPIDIPNLAVGKVIDINANLAYDNSETNIPSSLTSLTVNSTTEFCDSELDEDGNLQGCDNLNETLPSTNISTQNIQKRLGPIYTELVGLDSVALTTILSYSLGEQTISYPAGALGDIFDNISSPNEIIGLEGILDVKFIGANIESFAGVDSNETVLGVEGGEQILNIGLNSSKTDIYEEIVKNGFELARNSVNIQETNTGGDNLSALFSGKDVIIVKLTSGTTFEIGQNGSDTNLPNGKKTLVLIDANLKINGNLVYKNTDDSFGVIILRTKAGANPEVGNIFVAPNVQKIAGSYFADGGFMNNDGTVISTGNSDTTDQTNQLRLVGSLLSRNTLGGSLREGSNGEVNFTPWGNSTSEPATNNNEARRYDLHFVRRYYCDQANNNCSKAVPGETQNNAAFIIRPDNKATIAPPPGFKIR